MSLHSVYSQPSNTYNHYPNEKKDITGQQDKNWKVVDNVVDFLNLGKEGTVVYLVHVHHQLLPLLSVGNCKVLFRYREARAVALAPEHRPHANVQKRSSCNCVLMRNNFNLSFREAFKKKTIFFVTNVTLWGGGLERVHVTKKTIASKSFLSNFKHF